MFKDSENGPGSFLIYWISNQDAAYYFVKEEFSTNKFQNTPNVRQKSKRTGVIWVKLIRIKKVG